VESFRDWDSPFRFWDARHQCRSVIKVRSGSGIRIIARSLESWLNLLPRLRAGSES